jgi:hypothetical protein
MPLTSSDLAAAAVAENREEMIAAVKELMRGLDIQAAPLNNPAVPLWMKQEALQGALGYVHNFFRKFADFEEKGWNGPLETLLIALVDLESGALPALLKPREVGGTPMSYARQILAHHAALVLDELMNLGMSRAAGAREVAKEIGRADISLPSGKEKKKLVTAGLVISWRDRLNAGWDAMPDFIVEIWRRRQDRKPSRRGSRRGSQVVPPGARIMLQRFRQRMDRLAANLKT